jgi:hypothetical protein
MKQLLKHFLAISFAGLLLACNNNSSNKKEEAGKMTPDSSITTKAATAPSGPALPFDVITIYHTVKDYKVWRTAI